VRIFTVTDTCITSLRGTMGAPDEKKVESGGEDDDERQLEKARRFVEEHERRERDRKRRRGDSKKGSKGHRDRDRDRDRPRRSHRKGDDRSQGRGKKDGEGDAGRKKRERRRSESPSRRSKKHRRDLDKDDGHRRRKRDRKSDRKTDRKTDKAGHEDRKAKIDVSKLHPLGSVAVSPPTSLIDLEADYFAYHSHLRLYMYRSGGIHFEDLTSEESREAFRKFASMYNAGRLEEAYYNSRGVPPEALEEIGGRTRHRWAFRTNKTEEESLRLVRAGVKKQTEWSKESAAAAAAAGAGGGAGAAVAAAVVAPRPTPTYPGGGEGNRHGRGRQPKSREEIAAERTANRRLKEHVRTAHEEMLGGRKEGRERQIEKRRERADAIHGSARDREVEAMGGPVLDDNVIYGAGGGHEASFDQAVSRERRRKAAREQKKTERAATLLKKEEDKQTAMLEMLGLSGLKAGQKITIAPRTDG